MDYEAALKTCSEEVRAAIRWLEEHVKFDKNELESSLEKAEHSWEKNGIVRLLAAKYL